MTVAVSIGIPEDPVLLVESQYFDWVQTEFCPGYKYARGLVETALTLEESVGVQGLIDIPHADLMREYGPPTTDLKKSCAARRFSRAISLVKYYLALKLGRAEDMPVPYKKHRLDPDRVEDLDKFFRVRGRQAREHTRGLARIAAKICEIWSEEEILTGDPDRLWAGLIHFKEGSSGATRTGTMGAYRQAVEYLQLYLRERP